MVNQSVLYCRFLILSFFLISVLFSGCATKQVHDQALLGLSNYRRVVILGENVPKAHAAYYTQRYDAYVWFTPSKGWLTDSMEKFRHTFQTSHAMKQLVNELQSLSFTIGDWTIIVPPQAHKYFLEALKRMPDDAIKHAQGMIVFLEERFHSKLEKEVERVFGPNFDVIYE